MISPEKKIKKNRADKLYTNSEMTDFINQGSKNPNFNGFLCFTREGKNIVIRIVNTNKGYLIGTGNDKDSNKILYKDFNWLLKKGDSNFDFINLD